MSKTAAKILSEQRPLLPQDTPVPNRRVLVVDDEPEIAEAIRRFLIPEPRGTTPIRRSSRSGSAEASKEVSEFEVTVVSKPDQALKAAAQAVKDGRPFAMGFFDVMLGADIDGIELTKQIFAIDPNIYAVFVTAYQDRSVDNIAKYLGEGNREKWDYINKPFTEGEILQKARNVTSLWDLHRLKEWQAERLSEANQSLMLNERQNAIAAVGRRFAHEFGNILTHIVGNAELAIESKQPDNMQSALSLIIKATDTAADILQRFRKLNHSDDSLEVGRAIFPIKEALDEAMELLEFQFRKNRVVVKEVKTETLLLKGNRHAFVQVFVNLFINAIHAMPKGGEIQIQMSALRDMHEIRIRDTGTGIPESILDRVAEPMFTTKGKRGTGLGLSICKEIVEIEHHGEMSIRNYPGRGVEIILRIPLDPE